MADATAVESYMEDILQEVSDVMASLGYPLNNNQKGVAAFVHC